MPWQMALALGTGGAIYSFKQENWDAGIWWWKKRTHVWRTNQPLPYLVPRPLAKAAPGYPQFLLPQFCHLEEQIAPPLPVMKVICQGSSKCTQAPAPQFSHLKEQIAPPLPSTSGEGFSAAIRGLSPKASAAEIKPAP